MDRNPNEMPGQPAEKVRLDAERFREIHYEYRDRLINSIIGFVKDRHKAEDIAARAFNIAWEKRGMFRGDALPYTWIHAIARNEALNTARREKIAPSESIDQIDSREIPAPQLLTEELEKREDQSQLQKALERLPNLYSSVLTAHFIDGLSIREIAERDRVPPGTVLSRIFKGKQLLRDALERPGVSRQEHRENPDPPTWDR